MLESTQAEDTAGWGGGARDKCMCMRPRDECMYPPRKLRDLATALRISEII